ncbi:hypothetical protein BM221_005685 [Beauveria bassiana]|uniref:Uncharacterized protein n=1 Tax=Beauveria bassiana TaxID=176275 RepID=A0A2N6NPB1_BEABA|nr:hypothetical protein BM221_005685 [Beauveria bassiana]
MQFTKIFSPNSPKIQKCSDFQVSQGGIEPAGAGAGAHGEVEQTKPLNFKATLTGISGGEEG